MHRPKALRDGTQILSELHALSDFVNARSSLSMCFLLHTPFESIARLFVCVDLEGKWAYRRFSCLAKAARANSQGVGGGGFGK
jgi:hypothetical protein